MSPSEKEEFYSRFDKIEALIADLKDVTAKRYDEINKKLKDVIESQTFLSKQHDNFKIVVDNAMDDVNELSSMGVER